MLRLSHRPPPEEAPPVLSAFDVRTTRPVAEFDARLRSVLAPALRLALSQSYEGGDLPVDGLPAWFVASRRGDSTKLPEPVGEGADRGAVAPGRAPWDLQEWLYQFDPESEFRGWAWWDLTRSGEREARIWVDSWGESFFACDELRWLSYVAGGPDIDGPTLVGAADWVAAVSS
ncbi:hypothetical protein ABZT08_14570 [Streptomyces sp. NPDC005526]|uniref:hypothetical protein n=1 Tax=Streptomyces sp. NPDC005526 TaxID=3156885 RepID=UPI0033B0232A